MLKKSNKDGFDITKQKFEKAFPTLKVVAVIDYDEKYVVVNAERRDGKITMPPPSFKINKKTGKAERYNGWFDEKCRERVDGGYYKAY